MHRLSKVAAVAGMSAVLLLSAGCSATPSPVADVKPVLKLAGPWDGAKVTWSESGVVSNIVTLPVNIAYSVGGVSAPRDFYMYSPEGKMLAHVGKPKFNGEYGMTVIPSRVEGKTYVTVVQSLLVQPNTLKEPDGVPRGVISGFDENGEMLFTRVSPVSGSLNGLHFDPLTGDVLPEISNEVSFEGGTAYKAAGTFNGVPLKVSVNNDVGQSFLSGPGWKRELPAGAAIDPAGSYVYVHRDTSRSAANGGGSWCRLIDPLSGKDIDAGAMGSACGLTYTSEIMASSESQIISRSYSPAVGSILQAERQLRGVLLPLEGKSRTFDLEPFEPYSVDTDGTIYGELRTGSGDGVLASTNIDSKLFPTSVTNADRVPVAVTRSGIAAFPVNSTKKVDGPMVFAVKQRP